MKKIFKIIKEKTTEGAMDIFLKTGEYGTENCCWGFVYELNIPKELQK